MFPPCLVPSLLTFYTGRIVSESTWSSRERVTVLLRGEPKSSEGEIQNSNIEISKFETMIELPKARNDQNGTVSVISLFEHSVLVSSFESRYSEFLNRSAIQSPMFEENSKRFDLEERTFQFARRTRVFVKTLAMTIANVEDGRQVIRSSGSVGANYIEGNEALSKKDFVLRKRGEREPLLAASD